MGGSQWAISQDEDATVVLKGKDSETLMAEYHQAVSNCNLTTRNSRKVSSRQGAQDNRYEQAVAVKFLKLALNCADVTVQSALRARLAALVSAFAEETFDGIHSGAVHGRHVGECGAAVVVQSCQERV